MEKLRDIRGLEEIQDISFYLFLIMIVFGLLVATGIIMMLYRHFKSKKEDFTRKEVLNRLENIDLDNPKEAAYKITKYARYLASDERSQKIFAQLEPKLTQYKYKKNPPPLDEDAINHYHLFLEVLDG